MDGYLRLIKEGELIAHKRVKSPRDEVNVIEFWKKVYGKVAFEKCELEYEDNLPSKDIVFKKEKSQFKKGVMMKSYKAGLGTKRDRKIGHA